MQLQLHRSREHLIISRFSFTLWLIIDMAIVNFLPFFPLLATIKEQTGENRTEAWFLWSSFNYGWISRFNLNMPQDCKIKSNRQSLSLRLKSLDNTLRMDKNNWTGGKETGRRDFRVELRRGHAVVVTDSKCLWIPGQLGLKCLLRNLHFSCRLELYLMKDFEWGSRHDQNCVSEIFPWIGWIRRKITMIVIILIWRHGEK